MKPKIISKKTVYKCNWIKIDNVRLKLSCGKTVEWQKVKISDGVAVVALDNKNNIYLSKEWRIAWGRDVLQIPAGDCSKCKTEKAVFQQARNELREEIGLDARKWEKLVIAPLSARIEARMHIFLARDLFKSTKEKDVGDH